MAKGKGRIGYEALPAHDEQDEGEENEDEDVTEQHDFMNSQSLPTIVNSNGPRNGHTRPRSDHRRRRSASVLSNTFKVDIDALDARLQEWGHRLSKKFAKNKYKPLRDNSKPYEIIASAFSPVEPLTESAKDLPLKTLDHKAPLTATEFSDIVETIKQAIRQGVHPKLNKAGSSGSYFAKNPDGKTRGIFKPKNEEPYGSLNPKWSKWFHRHFLAPFFGFGRACLLPNFSYLSEAGASLLSERLELHIVPYTALVSLSSPAFFYDWLDRRAYVNKKKALPEKVGSFQLFLDGYKDASEFLKVHPWPGRAARDTLGLDARPSNKRRRRQRGSWTRKCRLLCGAAGLEDDASDDESYQGEDEPEMLENGRTPPHFVWTRELMEDFKLELEKLVILDVLMRNTDRGLDNFMVKVCHGECSVSDSVKQDKEGLTSVQRNQPRPIKALSHDINADISKVPYTSRPHIHIAAIDNSLSFPIHHPNSWRSYCYGWLFLPSSLIGQPFSKQTRQHFLPILTNPAWWAETVFQLRTLFSQDEDFNEKMFRKQIALLKGQAWNVVMSLRNSEEGPLELCRRTPCVVHDDEVRVADDDFTKELLVAAVTPKKHSTIAEEEEEMDTPLYRPPMDRSQSIPTSRPATPSQPTKPINQRYSSERPFMRRPLTFTHTTRVSPRPLPTSKHVDLNRSTFGSASGVSMMEHMERIQRREEDVAYSLGVSLPTDLDGEDIFPHSQSGTYGASLASSANRKQRQGVSLDLDRRTIDGDDQGQRFRSGSIDGSGRRTSLSSLSDRIETDEVASKVVVVERVEEVDARPYFVRC